MYADVVVSIRPETERAEAGADLGCCQRLPGAPRWDGGCCRSRVGCAPAGRSSELRHIGDIAAVAGACTLVVSGRGTRVGYGFGLFSQRLAYEDYATMFHGNDERVDQESLALSTQLWEAVARDLVG